MIKFIYFSPNLNSPRLVSRNIFLLVTWDSRNHLLVRICEEFYPGKGAAMRVEVSPYLNNKKRIIKRAHYTVLDRNSRGVIIAGFRIRTDLMRIRIRIRIQHFSNCGSGFRIRIPDPDPRFDDLKLKKTYN
jgi:hypothetical protein